MRRTVGRGAPDRARSRGLRGLTLTADPFGVGMVTLCVAPGIWVLRARMGIVQADRLARVMSINLDGDGDSA